MLVLSRRLSEKIVINPGRPDQVTIVVVEIERGKIKLGVAADPSVIIMREELLKNGLQPRNSNG